MGRTKRHRSARRNGERIAEVYDHVDLYQYLKSLGWENHNELRIGNFRASGKGLYSKKPIVSGDCIIAMPVDALISLKDIENNSPFKQHFDLDKLAEMGKCDVQFQSLLAYYLCYLRIYETSKYKPYLDTLPAQFTAPYFCSTKEMSFLPETVLKTMVAQNKIIRNNFAALNSLLKTNIIGLDVELFKWAYFVVNTRSVYLDPKYIKAYDIDAKWTFAEKLADEPNMALAPYLDLFNHSESVKTSSRLSMPYTQLVRKLTKGNQVELFYELITTSPFQSYSQIFISYGTHNNTKLLCEYGFFLENNTHDYLETSLDEINAFIKHDPELRPLKIQREKYRFIMDHNLEEQLFFISGDLLSHNLAVCLTILFVEQNIHQLKTIAFGETPSIEPIVDIALRLLSYKLKEYDACVTGLQNMAGITTSGSMAVMYLNECIKFLNKIKANLEQL
ncbi:SET domain-containing protein 4 [Sabethes cyaneus]|uniref:SET domain-containing protein 4 n=1 Tax=Sabethes cyaneus TaxID=53552 RepID=UPI00237E8839|nr:SET domain-containing protein 4 [Sabethes cyaneus]